MVSRRRVSWMVVAALALATPVLAQEAEEAFERGNEAYAAGDWAAAAAEYRTVHDHRSLDTTLST